MGIDMVQRSGYGSDYQPTFDILPIVPFINVIPWVWKPDLPFDDAPVFIRHSNGKSIGFSLGFPKMVSYIAPKNSMVFMIWQSPIWKRWMVWSYLHFRKHPERWFLLPLKPPFGSGISQSQVWWLGDLTCSTNSPPDIGNQGQIFCWLVVWNIFYFPIYWEFHHPNWRTHIFQKGSNHQPVLCPFLSLGTCSALALGPSMAPRQLGLEPLGINKKSPSARELFKWTKPT